MRKDYALCTTFGVSHDQVRFSYETISRSSSEHISLKLARINFKGLENFNSTYDALYTEINSRITTNGILLPKIANSYEFERIFMEEECSHILGRKKAVLLLDRVSSLLLHHQQPIAQHFHEIVDRLKIISTKEKYFIQSIVALDTYDEETVTRYFDEKFDQTKDIISNPFYFVSLHS